MRNRKGYLDIEAVVAIGGILFLIIVICVSCGRSISVGTGDLEYVEVTVVDKAVKNYSNRGTYLVYCEDANREIQVYQITDSLLAGRFNSSDVYGSIRVGKKYRFGVRGARNEIMSWYPNIYEFELISETETEK